MKKITMALLCATTLGLAIAGQAAFADVIDWAGVLAPGIDWAGIQAPGIDWALPDARIDWALSDACIDWALPAADLTPDA